MSYHVYITRGTFWAENQGFEIPAAEWLQFIDRDTELERDEGSGPFFAVFTGSVHSGNLWIDWSEGNLFANYPNRALQQKLLQVADSLGAIVQGDDGEVYTMIDDFPESVELPRGQKSAAARRPAYERREILWKVIAFGTIAAVIIAANVLDLW